MNKRTIRPHDGLDFALEIVGKANEMGLTNRKPRLLQSFELEFLMNDLAFLGIAPKRMTEMLKFFYKSWADRADMQEGWLITGEECQLHRYLKETLEFEGAMIEWEAPGVACKLLEDNPQLAEALAIDEVELIDAHLISRATQEMCALAARGNVRGTAADEPSVAVAEDYPCAPVEAVAGKLDVSVPQNTALEQRFFEVPQDEFAFVADTVADAISAGTPANSILVCVPNGAWATGVSHALQAKGSAVAMRTGDACLHGDLTSFDKSAQAQAATLLALVANPLDGAAWRCWCGFGVHMMHNAFFDELWRFGHDRDLDLVGSLDFIREHGKGDMNCSNRSFFDVMNRYEMAKNELGALGKLRGEALLDAVCAHVAQNDDDRSRAKDALASLIGGTYAEMNAAAMVDAMRATLKKRPWNGEGVRIGSLEDTASMNAKLVVATGMVNGFTPRPGVLDPTKTMPEKRDRAIARERDLLNFARSRCSGHVIATGFELIEAALAEKFKLSVERISIMESVRVARVQKSSVLESAE